MKKKGMLKLGVFCVIVSLVSIFTIPANALTQSESVSITSIQQARSNWCWAACAEMSAKNVYPATSRTQYSVVTYIKGKSTINKTGTLSEQATGSKYAAFDKKNYGSTSSRWTFSKIAQSLSKGYAVQAGGGHYSETGTRNGGHMVVIYGTVFVDNNSCTNYYISYADPWDKTTHSCTYDAFCDGTYNGRRFDCLVYVK